MNTLVENFLNTSFEEVALPLEISTRFNILECVGKNDFGETFILSEKSTKNLYVLKSHPDSENLTYNEAELLNGLKHRGLPSFDKTIAHDGTLYVLRKYIGGEPLNEYITQTHSYEKAIDVIISLCDILTFLHTQPEPIIHRDIKPSNIIIDPETDKVMLIDFGISRKYSETAEADTSYFGTHKFAPPEQYGFAQTDCRSDIYSLGMVMRYWLTGSADRKSIIPDKKLEHIAVKCTALAPEDRFQTASALQNALVKYKNRINRKIPKKHIFAISACLGIIALLSAVNMLGNQEDAPVEKVLPPPNETIAFSAADDTAVIYPTPDGYNDNDYQKIIKFMLQGDNLEKINEYKLLFGYEKEAVDLSDPQTWKWEMNPELSPEIYEAIPAWDVLRGVYWDDSTPKRIRKVSFESVGVSGELDLSGFINMTTLNINGGREGGSFHPEVSRVNSIHSLDLSGCVNLGWMGIANNRISTLDLSSITRLSTLHCHGNLLTELDISGLPYLETLYYHDNLLNRQYYITPDGYNVNDYQKFVTFLFQGDNLAVMMEVNEHFDIIDPETWHWETGNMWVTHDGVSGSNFNGVLWGDYGSQRRIRRIDFWYDEELKTTDKLSGEFDVSGFSELKMLYFNFNQITSFNLTGCLSLHTLNVNTNLITEIDLSTNIMLRQLDVSSNYLTSIDISHLTELREFICNRNELTSLVISPENNSGLLFLSASRNNLTDISIFENLPNLCYLSIWNNDIDLENSDVQKSIAALQVSIDTNMANPPENYVLPEWLSAEFIFRHSPQNTSDMENITA
ncbi:MAG: protein kinase [Oscillospiraceae bacterium]|nr:protein kinase [Oscillospiraceae bacterium]